MSFLESLMGGGQGCGQQGQDFQDFVNRYEQGPPWAGISAQEAMSRYQQVAPHLPPDVYQESAQEAFARLSPQERRQLARQLRPLAQQQNLTFPDLNQDGIDDRQQAPRYLAQVTGRMHQQEPGLLGNLLGGGGGGPGGGGAANMLDNPLAKAALAGITAMAVKRMMGPR